MPLLENLVEGLSRAAGATGAVSDIEKRKKERSQLSEDERKANLDLYNKAIDNIQTHMGTLDPESPQYKTLSSALQKAISSRTQLFHPSEAPSLAQKIGEKLHLRQPIPQNAGDARSGLQDALVAGLPVAPDEFPGITKSEDRAKAARIKHGLDPRALAEKPEVENWVPANVKFADGTEATLQRNSKSGEWTDLAGNPVPKERLATATIAPKPPKDKYAWKRDPKTRKLVSVKLDANGQIIPGTENPNIVAPAGLEGRISTSNYHYVDDKGQIHQIQETRTSTPIGAGGGGGTAAIPKTPGEAKKAAKQTAPESSKDKVIGFKGSKDYIDTKAAYQGAIDRTSTMEENLKNALNGDQQAMLSLVANHIGMTLGMQKGARITRAVWDEAVESAPWLERIAARFDDRGYLTGVTLAPDQMRSMVRLAHEKTQTLKEHLDRLDAERGQSSSDTNKAPVSEGDPLGLLPKKP